MPAGDEESDCAAHLPIAHWLPIVVFYVASQPGLTSVDVTSIKKAVQVDDEASDLSDQALRHVVLLGHFQRFRCVKISFERIEPKPLAPLTIHVPRGLEGSFGHQLTHDQLHAQFGLPLPPRTT